MAKTSKRTLDKSDTKRTVQCSFCGQEHRRRSRELQECRDRHRKGLGPAVTAQNASGQRRSGDEMTRYNADSLRGDKRAHSIVRLRKSGWPPRKIAKMLGLNLTMVEDVLKKS